MFDKITRESVLKALTLHDQVGREAFLQISGFGKAREYFLFFEDRLYDSKAVAAVAAHRFGAGLTPQTCTGGISNGAAVIALTRLGFRVVRRSALLSEARIVTEKLAENPVSTVV